MLFSSAKTGHIGQILSTGFFGEVLVNRFAPPSPDEIQAWGSMIIQLLVAIVTIWATIRKALQKPEAVVKVPVAPPATLTVSSGTVADPAAGATPLVLLGVLLGLGACASHQRAAAPVESLPVAVAPGLPAVAPDSVVVVRPASVVGRLLGQPPGRRVVAGGASPIGRIGKKAQVSIYYGPATVSTTTAAKNAAAGPGATSAAKAAAPVAGEGAVSQDYRKQGQRGGAAASGRQATATATPSRGLSWWWLLVPVLGYAGYRVVKRFYFA